MPLVLKDLKVARATRLPWHPKLEDLYDWQAVRFTGPYIITSAYRPGTNSIHGTNPLRAFDWSSKFLEDPLDVAKETNKHWIYDPERPALACCLYHAVCPKCGVNHLWQYEKNCLNCDAFIHDHWHFHNQVCDKTIYKG